MKKSYNFQINIEFSGYKTLTFDIDCCRKLLVLGLRNCGTNGNNFTLDGRFSPPPIKKKEQIEQKNINVGKGSRYARETHLLKMVQHCLNSDNTPSLLLPFKTTVHQCLLHKYYVQTVLYLGLSPLELPSLTQLQSPKGIQLSLFENRRFFTSQT